MKESVVFDFDGTIIDTSEGIFKCMEYALDKMGVTDYVKEDLKECIGPPLMVFFQSKFNMNFEDAKRAVAFYRERYREKGCYENRVYEGVIDMLKALKEKGVKVYVGSSKPTEFIQKILVQHNLTGYFDFVAGAETDGKRNEKEEVLKYLIESTNLNLSSSVMVGDRFYDVIGGHTVGLECIAVLYGFGNEQEFKEHGAEYIVHTPQDALKVILQN